MCCGNGARQDAVCGVWGVCVCGATGVVAVTAAACVRLYILVDYMITHIYLPTALSVVAAHEPPLRFFFSNCFPRNFFSFTRFFLDCFISLKAVFNVFLNFFVKSFNIFFKFFIYFL